MNDWNKAYTNKPATARPDHLSVNPITNEHVTVALI
jgi:hypothetical protein